MATLAGIVDDVYTTLYGIGRAERPARDLINGAITSGAVTFTVDTAALWKIGDYAEFNDGELVFVEAGTANPFTIARGQRGTTAAAQADNAVIHRNPTFPRFEIERLINQVVRNDLWPNVWTWSRASLAFVNQDYMYNLGLYIEEVVDVYQANLNADNRFYPLDRNWWDVTRQINTAVSTNGNLLRLRHVWNEAATVYYTAKSRPDPADLANMSDEVAELIPWAVAGKIEGSRTPATRHRPIQDRADRIEGGPFRDYRGFMGEFIRMRKELHTKLVKEVPAKPKFRGRRGQRAW